MLGRANEPGESGSDHHSSTIISLLLADKLLNEDIMYYQESTSTLKTFYSYQRNKAFEIVICAY